MGAASDTWLKGTFHHGDMWESIKGFLDVNCHEDPVCESGDLIGNVVIIDKKEAIFCG